MSYMFHNCYNLMNLNFPSFDMRNVINMDSMFLNCNNLINIYLKFNSNIVKNMNRLFCNCNNLLNIDLSLCNTENVTNMSGLFFNCNKITKLNLLNFNTKNVINMNFMFSNCCNLVELNFSSLFNTKNVKDMRYMFAYCNKLKKLNLSSFQALNGCDASYMFLRCTNLTYINLFNFDLKNVINNNMFFGCNKLINFDFIDINKENYNETLIINNKYKESNHKINIIFIKSSGGKISMAVPVNMIIADLLFNFYLKNEKGYEDSKIFLWNSSDLSKDLDKEIYKITDANSMININVI